MAHAPPPAGAFDELDPHGAGHHGQHASHVIVGPMQLRVVLLILLFFTALTVGFAQAEQWAAEYFNVVLPHWLNLVGAMSIATIKALLVMAIFMQLKYDNPINSLIMGVTFAALAVFIAFTGMDLFTRDRVYAWKAPQIIAGGTGNAVQETGELPPVLAARQRYMARLREDIAKANPGMKAADLEEAAVAQFAHDMAATVSYGHAAHHADDSNTPSRSRVRVGLSGALDAASSPDPDHQVPAAHPAPAPGAH